MNYDLALIAACLESRDVARAIRAGAESDLLGDEAQIYWDALIQHYDQYHETPTVDFFQGMYPTYEHLPQDMSVEALITMLKTNRLGSDIDMAIRAVADRNVSDPWEAKKVLVELADRINVLNQKGNTDLVAGTDKRRVLANLDALQSGAGLMGYSWPWQPFNDNSSGMRNGHVYYLYGRQKSRKTWLLIYLALCCEAMGLKVLFFSREMPREEIAERIYAMSVGLDYNKFTKGQLTTDGRALLELAMDDLAARNRLIVTEQAGGIAGFKAKIEEVRPDFVIHDYFKAIADDAMGEKFGVNEHQYVARTIDQIVSYNMEKAKVPMFLCGHANREGAKSKGRSSTEHAWSDHITRRVNAAIRVICDKANDRIALTVNAGRSIREDVAFTVNGHCCREFGEFISDDVSWVTGVDENDDAGQKTQSRARKQADIAPNSRWTPSTFKQPYKRR